MAIRNDPTRQRFPGITDRVIVDTYRGQVRFRSWPRKRGPKATPKQRIWRDWFTDATQSIKYAHSQQVDQAINMAKGTGLYPRDILMKALASGFFDAIDEDGVFIRKRWDFWIPIMFQGVFSNLTSNLVVPASTLVQVQWPLPVLDTLSFWNAAQPTRFTIPEHVQVVQLNLALMSTATVAGTKVMYVRKNGTTLIARTAWASTSRFSQTMQTSPLVVSQGDYFEAEAYSASGATLQAGDAAAFSLNVLQAQ